MIVKQKGLKNRVKLVFLYLLCLALLVRLVWLVYLVLLDFDLRCLRVLSALFVCMVPNFKCLGFMHTRLSQVCMITSSTVNCWLFHTAYTKRCKNVELYVALAKNCASLLLLFCFCEFTSCPSQRGTSAPTEIGLYCW
jgi:hypothetical protein